MSCTNIYWEQLDYGNYQLIEIIFPFELTNIIDLKDVHISLKNGGETLVIIVRNTTLWEASLYHPVDEDSLSWNRSKKNELIVSLKKKELINWPALVRRGLLDNDPFLLDKNVLSKRLQMELPSLPNLLEEKKGDEEEDIVKATVTIGSVSNVRECCNGNKQVNIIASPCLRISHEDENDVKFVNALKTLYSTLVAEDTEAPELPPAPTLPIMDMTCAHKKGSPNEMRISEKQSDELEKLNADPDKEAVVINGGGKVVEMSDADFILSTAIDEMLHSNNFTNDNNKEKDVRRENEANKKEDTNSDDHTYKKHEEEYLSVYNSLPYLNPMVMEEERQARLSEMETEAIKSKEEAIRSKMLESQANYNAAPEGSDEKKEAKKLLELTEKMLELTLRNRVLRSHPTSIKSFLEMQINDILQAKLNLGDTTTTETEDFAVEDPLERTMTADELYQKGLVELNNGDIDTAFHLLRLSACHYRNSMAGLIMFAAYGSTQLLAKGVQLLLQLAKVDPPDSLTNERVGDLFNSGAALCPPLWPLAVYFYQRAASQGSVHAISNLAVLHLTGECSGATAPDFRLRIHNNNSVIANYLIQCGIQRGCVASYLIRASQYALGSHGCPINIRKAKQYIERVKKAAPSIIALREEKIAGGITMAALEELVESQLEEKENEGMWGEATIKSTITNIKRNAKQSQELNEERSGVVNSGNDDAVDGNNEIEEVHIKEEKTMVVIPQSSSVVGEVVPQLTRTGHELEIADRRMPITVAAMTAKKASGIHSRGVKAQKFWERAAKIGVSVYGVYCVAFPIRVLLIPYFYSFVSRCMELVGLAPAESSNIYTI